MTAESLAKTTYIDLGIKDKVDPALRTAKRLAVMLARDARDAWQDDLAPMLTALPQILQEIQRTRSTAVGSNRPGPTL
jgi:hypothetical protein